MNSRNASSGLARMGVGNLLRTLGGLLDGDLLRRPLGDWIAGPVQNPMAVGTGQDRVGAFDVGDDLGFDL